LAGLELFRSPLRRDLWTDLVPVIVSHHFTLRWSRSCGSSSKRSDNRSPVRIVLTIIAVVLVAMLSTALIVPLFIDWSSHRADIASRLSAMTGGNVSLTGPVAVQLLPTPYLEVGEGAVSGLTADAPRLTFASARLELALVKLVSGAIRFNEIRLERPVLTIARGADGSLRLPTPPPAKADAVGFDRLVLRDGRIRVAEGAGHAGREIEGVQLDADALSLAGPYHISGRFSAPGGARVLFHLASEKVGTAGLPIRASMEAGPGWPALDIDGVLRDGSSSFSGSATLVGAAVGPEGPTPWRASGQMTANFDRATMEATEVRFGSEERALRANGSVALAYGSPSRLSVELKAKQANLDGLLRRKGEDGVAPARAISLLSGALGPALDHAEGLAIDASLSAETVILGSDTLSDISASLRSSPGSPLHTRFDLGLPGRSTLRGEGELETDAAAKFHGTVDFASDDIALLRDWASQGAPEFAAKAGAVSDALAYRSASLSGDVEASGVGFSGGNLKITLDRSALAGSLAFTSPVGADPGRLYMDLSGDSLDVAALPNLSASAALLGDLDLSLSLKANALHVAEVNDTEVNSGSLTVKVTKKGQDVSLDRLSVADLGGAYVDAQGAIGRDGIEANGHLRADRLRDFTLLISRLAPGDWSRTLAERAASLSPTSLAFEAHGGGSTSAEGPHLVSLKANGTIGQTQTALALEPGPKGDGQVLTLNLDSPDIGAFLRQLGLGGKTIVNGRAHLAAHASGAFGAGYAVDGSGALAGVDVAGHGRFLPAAQGEEARLLGSIKLKGANSLPLLSALGLAPSGDAMAPVDAAADVTLRGDRWTASRITATVAGVKASGDLNYEPAAKPEAAAAASDLAPVGEAVGGSETPAPQALAPAEITGDLSLERLSLGNLIALALGAPQQAKAGARWSEARFAPAPFALPPVAVHVGIDAFDLTDGLSAHRFAANLRLDKRRLDLDDIGMTVDGGAVSGRATIRRDRETATLTGALEADSLAIRRQAFSGRVGGALEFASTGRTAAALVEGLAGTGTARFTNAALARTDPAALDRVVAKAQTPDAQLDETNVAFAFNNELDRGPLPVPDGSTPIALSGGALKFGPLAITRPRGDAALTGVLDLRKLSLETRLAVTSPSAGLKFWSGPAPSASVTLQDVLDAPRRQVDVSALSAGLATQAIARESDRIAALEADIRERAFFNRRLKGERFMDRRAAEIEDWRVEQARLKGLAERLATERVEAERAAAEKAAAEKAEAEKASAAKATAERAEADKVVRQKAEAEKALLQPELPPDVPADNAPIGKPPVTPRDPSNQSGELGANMPPAAIPMHPAKPKLRPAAPPDPTAGGLY
jgi:uncharacterized protein involved in outer membrane biogenesis